MLLAAASPKTVLCRLRLSARCCVLSARCCVLSARCCVLPALPACCCALPARCCALPACCCALPARCCFLPARCCFLPARCCFLPARLLFVGGKLASADNVLLRLLCKFFRRNLSREANNPRRLTVETSHLRSDTSFPASDTRVTSKATRDSCSGRDRRRSSGAAGLNADGPKILRLRYFSKRITVGQIDDGATESVTMESSHFNHRPPHRTNAMKCPCTCCTNEVTRYFDPCTGENISSPTLQNNYLNCFINLQAT